MKKIQFQAINESDVIMCFANRGHQEELQWTQLFWFDTSELPDSDDEEILTAELRMFKQPVTDATRFASHQFDQKARFFMFK